MDEVVQEEYFDVLTKTGLKTGLRKPRGEVHRDGDYHRAVHVWIYCESTNELLLQKRSDCKDSWPGQWDISSAGHISAGDSSLITASDEAQLMHSCTLYVLFRKHTVSSIVAVPQGLLRMVE